MNYPPMPTKTKKARRPLLQSVPDYILFVLGVAGLVLSGWSLGTLLHDTAGAPWPVAVFAVAVFDLVALASGVLVYLRRADPWAAAGARITMTLALVSSSVVNGAHGAVLGGWTTACVLAAAPLAFEVVFELRHRTLTALVWVFFRKEAMTRLKYDAWTRIAIQAAPDIRMTASGTPEAVAETVERIRNGSGRTGIRSQVAELYESGVTDPDRMVKELPEANPESVKRYLREIRKGEPA